MRHFPGFRPSHRRAAPVAALLLSLAGATALAQEGVERKVLLRHDLDIPGREAVLAQVTIAPGAREGRHVHPGSGVAHVLSGTLTVEMDGEPVRTMSAGDSVFSTSRVLLCSTTFAGRSVTSSSSPRHSATARSMQFSSSRTLPGQS